jgi:hypothetical protein
LISVKSPPMTALPSACTMMACTFPWATGTYGG